MIHLLLILRLSLCHLHNLHGLLLVDDELDLGAMFLAAVLPLTSSRLVNSTRKISLKLI